MRHDVVFLKSNASETSTLFGIALLSFCNDAEVVKEDSSLSFVNPMNEVVKFIVDKTVDTKNDF